MFNNKRKEAEKQEKSKELEQRLVKMLWPVLGEMKNRVDRRLVKTFLGLVLAIVRHRHRNNGFDQRACADRLRTPSAAGAADSDGGATSRRGTRTPLGGDE